MFSSCSSCGGPPMIQHFTQQSQSNSSKGCGYTAQGQLVCNPANVSSKTCKK